VSVTDEEIALSIQQGNSEALADLVERHYSRLIGYLYLMLGGDRRQAEDLAQEAFLRTLNAIERYTYPRPFKPWLYAIAINLAHNHHDRAETRSVVDQDETQDGMPADGEDEDVEARVAQLGDIDRMLALLGKLPGQQREAIVLRYVDGLSLAEIADVVGVPVGTVKSRLSLGLSRIRTVMQQVDQP